MNIAPRLKSHRISGTPCSALSGWRLSGVVTGGRGSFHNKTTKGESNMKNTIEAEYENFIGVAELDYDYHICDIAWWERGSEGEERRVKLWDVPLDIKTEIRRLLIKEACQMEENSKRPDPMDMSHERKENC